MLSTNKNMEKGVSLYITIVVLSVLTASLLALVGISVSQLKIIQTAGNSVIAFYAADTGVEHCLQRIRKEGNFSDFSGNVGEASYNVSISLGTETIIKSTGTYRNTKRAIETRY